MSTLSIPSFEHQKRAFFLQQGTSLLTGACIGAMTSTSALGAATCGCLNSIFNSEVDYKVQILATALFLGVKSSSQAILNVDLSALTPLIIGVFNRKLAKNLMFLSVGSLVFKPEISSLLSRQMTEVFKAIIPSEISSVWQSVAFGIDQLSQYRLCQGIGIFESLLAMGSCSSGLAKFLLSINAVRPCFSILLTSIRADGIASIPLLGGSIASAEGCCTTLLQLAA